MIAPIERKARVFAALFVVATTVACLFSMPADVRAQLSIPVVHGPAGSGSAGGPADAASPTAAPASGVGAAPVPAVDVGRAADAVPAAGALPITRGRVSGGDVLSSLPAASSGFRRHQLQFPRVREAYREKWESVGSLLEARGVPRPAEIFLRVFKREQELEVWARGSGDGEFTRVRTYPVCRLSGRLGPKRMEGDGQIPEGFYAINLFNPQSEYHLSMRVNYPNAVDRFRSAKTGLASRSDRMGGDIFIHGGCATIGCVPIGDEWIEELYLIATEAREAGQRRIPVHIFPTRLDGDGMRWLAGSYGRDFVDFPLWENLQEGYLAFERTRTLPAIESYDGRYVVLPGGGLHTPTSTIAALR